MSYQSNIARNIKKYCKSQKITYSGLARKARIPLRTLQNLLYEPSRKEPRLSTVKAIATALKVKVDDLLR
ncbi:helix-turn-helix domain-containing protein [Candidatus Margulisiibacteriota bacterium]